MKAAWENLSARFAALSLRERGMVSVAVLALVVFVADQLFLAPIYQRAQHFARQAAQQQREFANLQQQLYALQAEATVDPSAATRQQLSDTDARLTEVDRQLVSLERTLVPPREMSAVLDRLLRARPGVRLVSLKTLPATPLTAEGSDGATGGAASAAMYRHAFELQLVGRYADLVGSLAELEQGAQTLLWERVALAAGAAGESTLTVQVFTLSLDSSWMKF